MWITRRASRRWRAGITSWHLLARTSTARLTPSSSMTCAWWRSSSAALQCRFYREGRDALELVKDNEIFSSHVKKGPLSLDYAYLIFPVEYKTLLGKIFPNDLPVRKEVYARFKQAVKKYKIGVIGK